MKKSSKIILIALLLFVTIFALTACDGLFSIVGGRSEKKEDSDVTVSLDLNGGQGVTVNDFISKGKRLDAL